MESKALQILFAALCGWLWLSGCGEEAQAPSAPGCTPGTAGCVCASGAACNTGLVCNEGTGACEEVDRCTPGTTGCACVDGVCLGGGVCGAEGLCEPPGESCPAGARGCPCDELGACQGTLVCGEDGRCEVDEAACPVGSEGCACGQGGRCGLDAQNQALLCQGEICSPPPCEAGARGCVCVGGATCASEEDQCQEGYCQERGCVPGREGCGCVGGSCDEGLACRGEVCVDGAGTLGLACREGGGCDAGLRCQEARCLPCRRGSAGCACAAGACEGALACLGELCVPPDEAEEAPARPRCYTPCQSSSVDALGVFRRCEADGLTDGCIQGLACVDGSCVPPGEEPPGCDDDAQCPDFQACIQGRCYSNCDIDADCGAGRGCDRHVCRQPCQTSDNQCPEGMSCRAPDGERGFCVALSAPGELRQTSVLGAVEVDVETLDFTDVVTQARLRVTNRSPLPQVVTLRKRSHTLIDEDATTQSQDLDLDNDGLADRHDNCPMAPNADQANADGDLLGDACDPDQDNDGDRNDEDPCPLVASGGCEGDADGDGVADAQDNCPLVANPGQEDANPRDQFGDACSPRSSGFECDPARDCPLFWLTLGVNGAQERTQELELRLAPGQEALVTVGGAGEVEAARWLGVLELVTEALHRRQVRLSYTQSPEGQWSGNIHYFTTFGANRLEAWAARPNPAPGSAPNTWRGTRDDAEAIEQVGNALVQRWGAFRLGRISWAEFQAVLLATQSGSWRFPNVRQDCPARNGECYLFAANTLGLEEYTTDREQIPVPSGVIDLPMALNLRQGDRRAPARMEGRIESSVSLHYAGNPSISLEFLNDPASCSREAGGACVTFLESLEAEIEVGGRFEVSGESNDCGVEGYALVETPWLVPGFHRSTRIDPETGLRERVECRDARLPFPAGPGDDPQRVMGMNLDLAISNVIPDGRKRRRSLRLLDGAMINQNLLFVLFEERFDSFLDAEDAEGFGAYGYMLLQREPVNLDPTDANANRVPDVYEGSGVEDARAQPEGLLEARCEAEVLSQVLPRGVALGPQNAQEVLMTLIQGVAPQGQAQRLGPGSREQVHYLCEDTGLFDGGAGNVTVHAAAQVVINDDSCGGARVRDGVCADGGPGSSGGACALGTDLSDCGPRFDADFDQRVACPTGSRVQFFTVDGAALGQAEVAALPCQRDGSCQETLNGWRQSQSPLLIQAEVVWGCADPSRSLCADDRLDLRQGKVFYGAQDEAAVFVPFQAATDDAFRYKTRFRNRQGQSAGFAPQICVPGSDQIPYCYDPPSIEMLRGRADCVVHIWDVHYDALDQGAREAVNGFLAGHFGQVQEVRDDLDFPLVYEGFERLYAELLIMQGDESVTRAFASRFDLAGQAAVSFEGSAFEPGGIDLSGVAGFEMYSLYQGVQYYGEALDRFYSLAPTLYRALRYGTAGRNFVTPEVVTGWFERLIRASTQRTRAQSEIARRYQNFNRPDLARGVIERSFAGAYLESIVFARMMLRIVEISDVETRDQLRRVLESAALRYRTALLDMRNIYTSITDEINYFGLAPDYIPLPALDSTDFRQSNAFELLLRRAQAKIQLSREREELAISSNRAFQSDTAQFQSELVRIRNTYENQLAETCGTFEGDDGRIYPATRKYAYLNEITATLGDPCGLVDNGEIYAAMGQVDLQRNDIRRLQVQAENLLASIEIERDRVGQQCDLVDARARFVYEQSGEIIDLEDDIRDLGRVIQNLDFADRLANLTLSAVTGALSCSFPGCAYGVSGAYATYGVASAAIHVGTQVTQKFIRDKEVEIANLNRETARFETESQCDSALIDSNARVLELVLQMKALQIEMTRADYQLRLVLSDVQRLRNRATRLQLEQQETEQLAINVEAARNDPNVRIYRNDAILNADLSFNDALQELYRATRVFEYYTSQSYANRDQLFLIRLTARGDYNLENYLADLQNSFYEFEESFGLPDTRVQVVSLIDDVLAIPRLDEEGRALSSAQRQERMRAALRDPARLNRDGHLAFGFSTELEAVSPLTRNHKILYVEAEISASDKGDDVARLYLRQLGTGTINAVSDQLQYYRFSPRTAVINPFFNGNRYFSAEVYRTPRLRDRPLLNTSWELLINQRDEQANQDLNLQSITDIRLFLYYTDFTALDD